jgi:DNA replication protein DnaC
MSTTDAIEYETRYVSVKLGRELTKAEADTLSVAIRNERRGVQCPHCEDMGWFGHDVGIEHPDFGKYKKCNKCPVVDDSSKVTTMLRVAGLPPRPMQLADFMASKQPNLSAENQARKAKNETKQWVMNGSPLLVAITGPTGCGKSHLAQGAAVLLAETGKNVWYLTGAEFSQQARGDKINTFKDRVMNIPYLVLDEAYVSYDPSGYIQATVSEILSYRYDRQLPSLLLGNIMDEKGKSNEEKLSNVIGQRLTSRLLSKDNGILLSMWKCKDVRRQN